jgi:hypothetical protein
MNVRNATGAGVSGKVDLIIGTTIKGREGGREEGRKE